LEAPSIFALFEKALDRMFTGAGIYLALGAAAAVCGILYRRGTALTAEQIICSAMLFSMMIPLLLPSMHERYFFTADVVGVAYLFWFPKRWYIPFSMAAASFLSYHIIYLVWDRIVPLEYLAVMLAVTTALCAMHLAQLLREPKQNKIDTAPPPVVS